MNELVTVAAGLLVAIGIAVTVASQARREPVNYRLLIILFAAATVVALTSAVMGGSLGGLLEVGTAVGVTAVAAGILLYVLRQRGDPSKASENRVLLMLFLLAGAAIILRLLGAFAR